jgi:hypothetical protein
MWTIKNSHSLPLERQNGTATLKNSLMVSYKTKHTITIWSSNCFWHLSKWAGNLHPHKNITWMFTATLFIITKRSPSIGEYINKVWYNGYLIIIKINEPASHGKTWKNLKCILLTKRNQFSITEYYMTFRKIQNYGDIKRLIRYEKAKNRGFLGHWGYSVW